MPKYEYTCFSFPLTEPLAAMEQQWADWSRTLGHAGWQIVGSHVIQPSPVTPYAPTTLVVLLQREVPDA